MLSDAIEEFRACLSDAQDDNEQGEMDERERKWFREYNKFELHKVVKVLLTKNDL